MKRWLAGLALAVVTIAGVVYLVAWASRDREFGDEFGWW